MPDTSPVRLRRGTPEFYLYAALRPRVEEIGLEVLAHMGIRLRAPKRTVAQLAARVAHDTALRLCNLLSTHPHLRRTVADYILRRDVADLVAHVMGNEKDRDYLRARMQDAIRQVGHKHIWIITPCDPPRLAMRHCADEECFAWQVWDPEREWIDRTLCRHEWKPGFTCHDGVLWRSCLRCGSGDSEFADGEGPTLFDHLTLADEEEGLYQQHDDFLDGLLCDPDPQQQTPIGAPLPTLFDHLRLAPEDEEQEEELYRQRSVSVDDLLRDLGLDVDAPTGAAVPSMFDHLMCGDEI